MQTPSLYCTDRGPTGRQAPHAGTGRERTRRGNDDDDAALLTAAGLGGQALMAAGTTLVVTGASDDGRRSGSGSRPCAGKIAYHPLSSTPPGMCGGYSPICCAVSSTRWTNGLSTSAPGGGETGRLTTSPQTNIS